MSDESVGIALRLAAQCAILGITVDEIEGDVAPLPPGHVLCNLWDKLPHTCRMAALIAHCSSDGN